jgi:Mg/Co/Ni transporter MgtE
MIARQPARTQTAVVDSDRLIGMLAQADVVHEVKDKKEGQLVEEISQPGESREFTRAENLRLTRARVSREPLWRQPWH